MTKEEICENCGKEVFQKDWHWNSLENRWRCKKFKPSQGMTQEVPQNHSPQKTKYSEKDNSFYHTEDKGPEGVSKNSSSGSDDEIEILNKKINKCVNDYVWEKYKIWLP